MNCYQHPEALAVAYCRSCGKPLCDICQRPAEGTIFCPEHAPFVSEYSQSASSETFDAANPYAGVVPPTPSIGFRTSPALAFLLGWIPGVGAIYNGQYIKGLVHAVIFGLFVSLLDSDGGGAAKPFLGIMLAAFIFYMAFEAHHTAKKRRMGLPVAEWSSLALSQNRLASRTPIGPMVLIAIGVLFLLDTLHLVEFREIGRFWPVILIIVCAVMLYSRVSSLSAPPPDSFNADSANPGNAGSLLEVRREQ